MSKQESSAEPSREYGSSLTRQEKDEILRRYVPMVRKVVLRLAGRSPRDFDFGETMNAGLIGLMDAIEKYDPAFENSFVTYAQHRVRGAILDSLRAQDWLPRSYRKKLNEVESATRRLEDKLGRSASDAEVARELGISEAQFERLRVSVNGFQMLSIEDLIPENRQPHSEDDGAEVGPEDCLGSASDDPLTRLLGCERAGILEHAIQRLAWREREVLRLYYNAEMSLKAIGESMGITESRASQIRSQALRRLKHQLQAFLL